MAGIDRNEQLTHRTGVPVDRFDYLFIDDYGSEWAIGVMGHTEQVKYFEENRPLRAALVPYNDFGSWLSQPIFEIPGGLEQIPLLPGEELDRIFAPKVAVDSGPSPLSFPSFHLSMVLRHKAIVDQPCIFSFAHDPWVSSESPHYKADFWLKGDDFVANTWLLGVSPGTVKVTVTDPRKLTKTSTSHPKYYIKFDGIRGEDEGSRWTIDVAWVSGTPAFTLRADATVHQKLP